MKKDTIYNRHLLPRLRECLSDSPVTLVHGPRQCGKTTFARRAGEADGYAYISFDDDVQMKAAANDPAGYVADLPERVILDEVQRVPGLFTALKLAVDRDRSPGRFILTGSANVMLTPKLADSLAGRISILRLHPLSQAEIAVGEPRFLSALFGGKIKAGSANRRLGQKLAGRVAAGGYPVALARKTARRRTDWYADYIDTLIQRDIRDLSRIKRSDDLLRLLTAVAGQTARMLNVSDLASPLQVSRPTIREYISLLSQIFLLEELPPWHSNRLSRLVKTPKLHIGDTGLACSLLGFDGAGLWNDREMFGQMLETFVYQELRRQADCHEDAVRFSHFRDKDGVEIDIVLEHKGRIFGVEVKASSTVTNKDFKALRKLRDAAGRKFAAGVILYDGEAAVSFEKGLRAAPVSCLWEMG